MAKIRAKKKGAKKVSGVKKAPKKAAKKSQVKSLHKDTKSHNVKISVMSGNNKLSAANLKFLQIVKKNSKGYIFKAKIVYGMAMVIKETANGTPMEMFSNIGDINECTIFANELNKGQKYVNVKIKNVK